MSIDRSLVIPAGIPVVYPAFVGNEIGVIGTGQTSGRGSQIHIFNYRDPITGSPKTIVLNPEVIV
jgi:hypothetical protein